MGDVKYHFKGKHDSSPPHVLRRMKDHLKKAALKKSDEAWLVVDKDQWTDKQLVQLNEWSQGTDNYGFALSNPKFEYWLLLHFEEGAGITSSKDCSDRLKRHLPDYDKGIDPRKFSHLSGPLKTMGKCKSAPTIFAISQIRSSCLSDPPFWEGGTGYCAPDLLHSTQILA